MNARQLLIVLGIAVAGFAAAFLVSGSSGSDAEPAKAGKQPAAADTLEVAGATVNASAPAGGNLPALKVPKPKKEQSTSTTTAPTTTAPTTTAPTTTAPTTTAPTTTAPTTTAPTTQTPPATNNNNSGDGGFLQTGGED
jgi:hypothetical protein